VCLAQWNEDTDALCMYVWLPVPQSACATMKYDKLPTCQGLQTENPPREIDSGRIQGGKCRRRKSFPEMTKRGSRGSFNRKLCLRSGNKWIRGLLIGFEICVRTCCCQENEIEGNVDGKRESAAYSCNIEIWLQKIACLFTYLSTY